MSLSFYIVEDDRSVQKILERIIVNNHLGHVCGTSETALKAVEEIAFLKPDVLLVDFLLPDLDGLEVIRRSAGIPMAIVMISEVANVEMIAKAYQNGIEFYIHKPINVVEIVSILEKIQELLSFRQVLQSVDKAYHRRHKNPYSHSFETPVLDPKESLRRMLSQLGILGEAGINEVLEAILWVQSQRENQHQEYRLSDLYTTLSLQEGTSATTVEQRIRRTICRALSNLAAMGLEDYSNETFQRYAPVLFDFPEIRQQMSFLKGMAQHGGKISIKRFLEGLSVEFEAEHKSID